ncbi:nicotinate-nucleotide adenylyltransferase [Candidatus Macondimonas diazotrophica]|jgi:nicotinate-nucleotide adenylyltransferase|nr:nicotinate-nucleotide adenylyltransferase [Candidatus Macondimonas diazotrophica]
MMAPIGLLGGTFDPVHLGHMRIALEVMEALAFQEVRFIPAASPPHRSDPALDAHARVRLLRAAIADQPGFTLDLRELERPGPSYMVDTLIDLRGEVGTEQPLCLILGMDAFSLLPSWHRWEALAELTHVVVASRPGGAQRPEGAWWRGSVFMNPEQLQATPAGGVYFHRVTALEISATRLRQLINQGQSPRYLVPDAVWRMIDEEHWYQFHG